MEISTVTSTLPDGTVYSKRKNFCPFSTSPLESYVPIVGEDEIERLLDIAQRLKGLKLLEISATVRGGGVAEMLYSSIPFLNALGIEAEWKILNGRKGYFECTKRLHNLLQGMLGSFTPEMEQVYHSQLEELASTFLIDYTPDVVIVHDPQPLGLTRYLKGNKASWIWRCHIDIEPIIRSDNGLLNSLTDLIGNYNASIFSTIHYVYPLWDLPKFIIPPFIDPLSEKNRELAQEEIDEVLIKYRIDTQIPIIAQIGRFDPWKGLDRTIAVYRRVREEKKCQLVLAGGFADDDPEGERVFADVCSKTRDDKDIHILRLSLDNRLENYREVNALQRAASLIMQPSTREGFGLVITESMWKGKPVIAGNVGGIPFQIMDGDTGYYYQTTQKTAQKVLYLLNNPTAAAAIGKKGQKHVREHFAIPARIADYLMAIDMTMNMSADKKKYTNCITSFYPWFRLQRQR